MFKPAGKLKKAIACSLNQREYLCAFLERGEIDEISDNQVDRFSAHCRWPEGLAVLRYPGRDQRQLRHFYAVGDSRAKRTESVKLT